MPRASDIAAADEGADGCCCPLDEGVLPTPEAVTTTKLSIIVVAGRCNQVISSTATFPVIMDDESSSRAGWP